MSCFCCGNSSCVRSGYERIVFAAGGAPSKAAVWKMLWTKMKKEKRRFFFHCSPSSAAHIVPYDPYSYSQNFDQGSMADPENLFSRSFSARFAVSARLVG